MQQFENFLTDRGSKYAVSGGPVTSRAEVKAFLKALCRDKRYAKRPTTPGRRSCRMMAPPRRAMMARRARAW